MKLNDEQKKILETRLRFLNKASCPLCEGKKWVIHDTIFEIREFHGGNFVVGGKSAIIPVVSVSCATCGHTLFFNAIQIGLLEKENDKPK